MIRLGRLLLDHEGAIEADLSERFINLWADLGTERLTWPRLRNIVARLGPTSNLYRELNPEGAGWGVQEHLLAALINVYGAAHGSKDPIIQTPAEKRAARERRDKVRRKANERRKKRR